MLLLLIVGVPLFGSGGKTNYDRVKAEMRTYIEQLMQAYKLTGLSIALVDEEETVWAEGFGYADLVKRIRADERTVFNLASISKTFTGIAIMQLVEQGRIDLDRPLTDYLPEFSIKSRFRYARPFTIRDMLTHHSGLPGDIFYPDYEPVNPSSIARYNNYEQILLDYMEDVHLAYRPGYVHSYCNNGYDLLSFVVERVSGMSFIDYTERYIFQPLGMDASFKLLIFRDELGDRVALPHMGGQQVENTIFLSLGAGSSNSDVTGMAAYIKMLLAGGSYRGQRILSEESLNRMLTRQNDGVVLDQELKMGLSFFLDSSKFAYAGRSFGHSGNLKNYDTNMTILPDHGLGVIVMANSTNGRAAVHEIAQKSLMKALELKKGISPPPTGEPAEVVLTPEQAQWYTGLYALNLFGDTEISAQDNRLFVELMGMKIELNLLEDGWLKLVTMIPMLKDSYIKIVEIQGKRRVYAKDPTMFILLGEEHERSEKANCRVWRWRAGEYRVVPLDESLKNRPEEQFRLTVENGLLTLSSSKQKPRLLIPLNRYECLVAGVGRSARETVYFEEENGRTIIKWSGYTLEKIR